MSIDDLLAYMKQGDSRRRLREWLVGQHLADTSAPDFALTPRTKRLIWADDEEGKQFCNPFVLFVAIPSSFPEKLLSLTDKTAWKWMDVAERRYDPLAERPFLPRSVEPMAGGLIATNESSRDSRTTDSYVALEFCGVIEMGLGKERGWTVCKEELAFMLVPVMGRLLQFVRFVADTYENLLSVDAFSLLVNLRGTYGSTPSHLTQGSRSPWEAFDRYKPICLDPHVQLRRQELDSSLCDDDVEALGRELAGEMEAAWGHGGLDTPPRCYVRNDDGTCGGFDVGSFSGMVR